MGDGQGGGLGEGHKDLCMSSLQGPSQRKLQSWGLLVGGRLYFMGLLFFFPVLCFCSQMSIPSPLTNRASGSDFLCVLVKTQWNTCCSSFLVLSSVPLDDDLSLCKYRVCPLLMRHRKPQLEDDPPTVFLLFSIVSCCPTVLFHRDFRTSLSVSEKHLTGILVGIGLNL